MTAAFGLGLSICFIPLPVHLPLAALLAIVRRVNVPTIVGTMFLVNPFTVVPVFYTAYRVGAAVLGEPVEASTSSSASTGSSTASGRYGNPS